MMDDETRQSISHKLELWRKAMLDDDVDAAIEAGKLFLGQTDEGDTDMSDITDSNVLSDAAREARNRYIRDWRAHNKDKVKSYNQKWKGKNKDKIKQYEVNYWEKKAREQEDKDE